MGIHRKSPRTSSTTPLNQGTIEAADEPGVAVVFGEVGSIACGDALRLHLKIQEDAEKILDARVSDLWLYGAPLPLPRR